MLLDQISKKTALSVLEGRSSPCVKGPLVFKIIKNRGAALGFLRRRQSLLKALTSVLLAALIVYMLYSTAKEPPLFLLSLSFIAGGAAGNLADRIREGYVVDFFTFGLNGLPYFNLADMFIFAGAAILTGLSILEGRII